MAEVRWDGYAGVYAANRAADPLFSPRVIGTTESLDERVKAPPGSLPEQLTVDPLAFYRVTPSVNEPREDAVARDTHRRDELVTDPAFFRRGIFAKRSPVKKTPDAALMQKAVVLQARWRGVASRRALTHEEDASVDKAIQERILKLMRNDEDASTSTKHTAEAFMRTPVSTWVDDSDAATVETATARTAEPSVDDPSITTSRKGEILRRALVTGEPLICAGPIHLNLILASGKRRGLVVDHRGGDAVTRECCCFLPWVPWQPWLFCACSDSIRTGGTRTACLCCSYSDVVRATYYPSSKAIKIEGCLSCCIPHPFGQHLHVPRGIYGVDAPVASFGCLCPVFRGRERFDLYDDGTIRPAPRPDLVVGRRHVVRDNRLCLVRASDMQRRLVFSDVLRQAKAGGGRCVCKKCRRKWCGCCRRSSSKPVEPVRVRLRRLDGVCRCHGGARRGVCRRDGTCAICGRRRGANIKKAPTATTAGQDTSITAAERRKEEQRQERAAQLARQEEAQIDAFVLGVLGEKRGAAVLRREKLKPKNEGLQGKTPEAGCSVM
jgi:hypothetical protein